MPLVRNVGWQLWCRTVLAAARLTGLKVGWHPIRESFEQRSLNLVDCESRFVQALLCSLPVQLDGGETMTLSLDAAIGSLGQEIKDRL
jgi:hypothetical protein